MGLAPLVAVPDVDHSSYLDPEMRASGFHREAVRDPHVQLSPDRPVHGSQQEVPGPDRRQNGGKESTTPLL